MSLLYCHHYMDQFKIKGVILHATIHHTIGPEGTTIKPSLSKDKRFFKSGGMGLHNWGEMFAMDLETGEEFCDLNNSGGHKSREEAMQKDPWIFDPLLRQIWLAERANRRNVDET